MPHLTQKQITQLRKLDQLACEWIPPEDFSHRVSRDEIHGTVTARIAYTDGTLRDVDIYYDDTITVARRKLNDEIKSLKAELKETGT